MIFFLLLLAGIIYILRNLLFGSSSMRIKPQSISIEELLSNQQYYRNKVIWITGASSGIGAELSLQLSITGCKLILSSRSESGLLLIQQQCIKLQQQYSTNNNNTNTIQFYSPVILPLDLSIIANNPSIATELTQKAIKCFNSPINILINNAGQSVRASALETTAAVDTAIFATGYFGPIALTKAVVASMQQSNTNISNNQLVLISSVQGLFAVPNRSAYSASKHAISAWFESLRCELLAANNNNNPIQLTVISPGYVSTNLSINALTGTGEQYNQLDIATASGYTVEYTAAVILNSIRLQRESVILAEFKIRLACLLSIIAPELLTKILVKRLKKEQKSKSKQS